MLKPKSNEEYPAYYQTYIDLVPAGDLKDVLTRQLEETLTLLLGVTEKEANYRYAQGKWTLKEVIGHITDVERIMSYRLLRISRGDQTPLAGYDDEQYVKEALFRTRLLSSLLDDYKAVRNSTISLLNGLPHESETRKGFANNGEISVRALAYIIAGHELHHVNIIKEKYLV
ncbi:DinB family protein [Bacillus sp. MUM 13]|uniref:DinB family protein n=1 Tax=Bacillus sp. MUM 13 TaxID=1678001 RepID=UPI0008F5E22F|nr:DinB family protein [Bacillus sp. MUM 13]OIK13382.1 damage-inducible protein DinB [Bacillus sp. MUM 13]